MGLRLLEPEKDFGEWEVCRAQVVVGDMDLNPDDEGVKFVVPLERAKRRKLIEMISFSLG